MSDATIVPPIAPSPVERPATDRTVDGRFAAGNPGGPGRPRGPVRRASELDRLAAEALPDVMEMLLQKARNGEQWAIEQVIRRAWPLRKGRALEIEVPPIEDREDVRPAQTAVTEAMLAGKITPQEGADAVAVIAAQERCINEDDRQRRLDAINRKYGA